jgi:amino acid permease
MIGKSIAIVIIVISIFIVVIIESKKKRGELKDVDTYSYHSLIKTYIKFFILILIGCIFIYTFSKSFELTISLGVFLFACLVASFINLLLSEYQIKRKGGKRRDSNRQPGKR